MRVASMTPAAAVGEARQLMIGQASGSAAEGELASSVYALLVCEGKRDGSQVAVFVSTLMLSISFRPASPTGRTTRPTHGDRC
jgi:hypothetical protein